jgi:CRISPR-associated protein Cas1
VVGAHPALGFIHEDSSNAFTLDVADLYRDECTLPIAFAAVRESERRKEPLERLVRMQAGRMFRQKQLVSRMIERMKELFDGNDGGGHP